MQDKHIIYLHRNKINNKVYIGQTIYTEKPEIRWGKNGNGYKNQKDFYNEIVEYGWDNFEHIILENDLTSIEADKKEREYIAFYDSTNTEKGYNRSPGSGQVSIETRQKMSENWHEKSPTRLAQARENIKLNRGSFPKGEKHFRYGDHSKTGANALRKRAVQCIETGEIFPTLTLASQWCNPNGSNLRSHIAAQIQGKRGYCGKHPITKEKLHWRYVDDIDEKEEKGEKK